MDRRLPQAVEGDPRGTRRRAPRDIDLRQRGLRRPDQRGSAATVRVHERSAPVRAAGPRPRLADRQAVQLNRTMGPIRSLRILLVAGMTAFSIQASAADIRLGIAGTLSLYG